MERDHNNQSVKKSRLRARQQKRLDELRERRERLENRTPEEQIKDMESEILLLIKAYNSPDLLTRTEKRDLSCIITDYTGDESS